MGGRDGLVSKSRAAEILSGELGYPVRRGEVAFLVRHMGIAVWPMPSNGKGDGLDAEGMRKLRQFFRAGSPCVA